MDKKVTCKCSTIDGFSTSAISNREVTSLYHEITYYTMENNTLVMQWFTSSFSYSLFSST